MKPYEFTGTIKKIENTETIQTKRGEFKKRQFTAECDSDSKYPTVMYFELQNDSVDAINGMRIGQEVTVSFYVDCRSWTNPTTQKTLRFVTLKAVKVVAKGEAAPMPDAPDAPEIDEAGVSDDLPF